MSDKFWQVVRADASHPGASTRSGGLTLEQPSTRIGERH